MTIYGITGLIVGSFLALSAGRYIWRNRVTVNRLARRYGMPLMHVAAVGALIWAATGLYRAHEASKLRASIVWDAGKSTNQQQPPPCKSGKTDCKPWERDWNHGQSFSDFMATQAANDGHLHVVSSEPLPGARPQVGDRLSQRVAALKAKMDCEKADASLPAGLVKPCSADMKQPDDWVTISPTTQK